MSDNVRVHSFMQLPMFERSYVPFLLLIDREGVIRFQHTGSETDYFSDDVAAQTAKIKGEAEKLLAVPPARPARRSTARKNTK